VKKGDRVKLKGREPIGYVKTMGSDNNWIRVNWDKGKEGPKYVDKFELEIINETTDLSSSCR
jgi:hypothetical protein